MKRSITFALALVSLLAVPTGSLAEEADETGRPNLVMIFTDDQRHDAVGYVGNIAVHTPNLDRLAQAGLVFNNCFVNTSICAISRANLLSGQYPSRHGIDDFHKTFTAEQLRQTVPARLREHGYQTALFGKWGIGDSPERTAMGAAVFDYWAGQPKQTNYFHDADCRYVHSDGFHRPIDNLCDCPADARGRAAYDVRIGTANLTDPIHVDSTITPLHVARFLDGRDKSKPFFLALFFKSPHGPFTDWDPKVAAATAGRRMPLPPSATKENAANEPEIIKNSLGWPAGQNLLGDRRRHERSVSDYYRSIASMDLGVGRILDELEKRGLADNTVILFTSDNGHFSGEHGLGGKWLMYEPSLRVPGFLYDPRKPVAATTDRMVLTTDFSATLLSLAGLEVPDSFAGRDLTVLQADPQSQWRNDFLYTHPYGHGGKIPRTLGVRTERHVYTRYLDPDPPFEQLFDLKSDPDQLDNLAGDSQHADLLKRLRERCDELNVAHGAEQKEASASSAAEQTTADLGKSFEPFAGEPYKDRDLYADTWVATDALGRVLPGVEETGPVRKDRFVGIFYWTWHIPRGPGGPHDNTKLIATAKDGKIAWSARGCPHHWGQPELGYYLMTDPFVIQKHASMLVDAGIDVVFFDTTNGAFTWKDEYDTLCRVYTEMRAAGNKTPSIGFICPFGNPMPVLDKLWKDLYQPGLWSDLWFRWGGKPLILANPRHVEAPEIRSFFTFRRAMPDYWKGPSGPNQWSWLEVHPQHVFHNDRGEAEQMSVGVAQNALPGTPGPAPMSHARGAMGRSWHDNRQDLRPNAVNLGLNFDEQWRRAIEVDPKFIFVTGWNEWIAGRYTEWSRYSDEECYFSGGLFVDQYNQEYSRDCEPMAGGHTDNYYYQLASWVRRFKGVRPLPSATGPSSIVIDGDFSDWDGVMPEYRDTIGDVRHRNHRGYGDLVYRNTTGRNDFVITKSAFDAKNLYFFVQTNDPVTPHTDPMWMLLLLDTDQDTATGWLGYDYIVNSDVTSDRKTTVKRWHNGQWQTAGHAEYRVNGNGLEVSLARGLVNETDGDPAFDFHWADNIRGFCGVAELGVNGDSAPNRRWNYRFLVAP